MRDLRHQLYARLQRLSLAFYDRTPSGAILSRMMDDVGAIQVFVTGQTSRYSPTWGRCSPSPPRCWRATGGRRWWSSWSRLFALNFH